MADIPICLYPYKRTGARKTVLAPVMTANELCGLATASRYLGSGGVVGAGAVGEDWLATWMS